MKKILIIEDDEIVANIYRNKLCLEGFSVEIAADGEAGLQSVHQTRPDAVILDLMLPKLSGVDLLKKVRAEPAFEKLPIIVFSNTYLANMIQEAWKAGATKCLSKASCSPNQFVTVVKATVNGNGTAAANSNGTAAPAAPPKDAAPSPKSAPKAEESNTDFLEVLPSTIAALRMLLQACSKETGPAQLKHLESMYRHAHAITSKTAVAELWRVAQLSDALEALLKELFEKPGTLNASTLRTVASAIDFLGLMVERGVSPTRPQELMANILVVDDEPISRRALIHALQKTKLKAISVDNATLAYELLAGNQFDLIFLDVDMPGMNGYELCTKIRALPDYKSTPIVFVTGLSDLEARANSMISGGNDFIAKPFLFLELAVKTLVYVLRAQLQS
jgi:DNA-binding response OmpR family regulator